MPSKFFDIALKKRSKHSKIFVDKSLDIVVQIHEIMERKGKTQKDLANALGKKESEISKWLSGWHNLTIKTIAKIEAVLGEDIIIIPMKISMPQRPKDSKKHKDNFEPLPDKVKKIEKAIVDTVKA